MAYRVRIDNFEGPFDLLLYLVSRQKVDIGSINIAEIADQYLEEMRQLENLDLDVASDFVLVAATLLKIKAESLLPEEAGQLELDLDIAELTPSEARDMLVEKLVVYKQYKNAAASLSNRAESEARMHPRLCGPEGQFLGLMPDYLAGVKLERIASLAAQAFARREIVLLESEHIAAKPIPVERYVRSIHERITTEKRLRFSQLVDEEAPIQLVVVTFLAILELFKRSKVTVRQDEAFGDIQIDYIEGSGELQIAGADEITSSKEG